MVDPIVTLKTLSTEEKKKQIVTTFLVRGVTWQK